ncbi:sodium:solute symporter [Membranicola marinus]|uniref:Sodium:solute symporter n=1 Tax=Membranihabitans marinus TaxID=1227546 RepID=A0A953LCX1_9BACT|nr:sodium:solute symporter [Membranihabitans marinus]MBY5959951.1 sodium:solute symporter [Membranihabitans marinus]
MTTIDYVLFFTYLIGIILLGASFYSKNKSSDAFTTGNQKFPAWAVTLSIFATFVSSISYLALPGSAYMGNWNVFVFSLSLPIAALIAVRYFVPLYRRVNSPSAYTFLENRFGLWARIYVSACYLLTQVMRIGTILYLLAITVHTITDWNIPFIILLTGISVLIYSIMGGIQAVIWTDAIQAIVLIGGALICIVYLLVNIPGGWDTFVTVGQESGKFSLGSYGLELDAPTFWVVLIYGLFINLQNYGIDQNYVQRYVASSSDKNAGKSALWGGLLYIPVSLGFLLIGTLLYVYYQTSGSLPTDLMGEGQSDKVFPYFIVQELPAGMTGILIASIFAAGMSTVSTSFNSGATVIYTDYYKRFFAKETGKDHSMRALYVASAVLSVLGMIVALAMINVKSALDAWWSLASIFSGGMLGLFLLGAFARRTTQVGAIAGVVAGLLLIVYLNVLPFFTDSGETSGLHSYLTIVLSTTLIFLVGFLVSIFFGKNEKRV